MTTTEGGRDRDSMEDEFAVDDSQWGVMMSEAVVAAAKGSKEGSGGAGTSGNDEIS